MVKKCKIDGFSHFKSKLRELGKKFQHHCKEREKYNFSMLYALSLRQRSKVDRLLHLQFTELSYLSTIFHSLCSIFPIRQGEKKIQNLNFALFRVSSHVLKLSKQVKILKNNNVIHRKIAFFPFFTKAFELLTQLPEFWFEMIKTVNFTFLTIFHVFQGYKMGQLPKNNNVIYRKIVFFPIFTMALEILTQLIQFLFELRKTANVAFFHDFSRVLLL